MHPSRIIPSTLLSPLAIVLLAAAGIGQQVGVGGDMWLEPTPLPTVVKGGSIDTEHMRVFLERSNFQVPMDLSVDIDAPGVYGGSSNTAGQIPAGTLVDVYFVHQDTDTSGLALLGHVILPEDILGILVTKEALKATDVPYGADPMITTYPGDGEHRDRGIESGSDTVHLFGDLRRIEFQLKTNAKMDQVRIFTRARDTAIPFTPFCFGQSQCPCMNDAGINDETGCLNSTGQGGRLIATGSNDISADDLSMEISGLPARRSTVLFMAPHAATAPPFSLGDGLLCVRPGPIGSPAGSGYLRFPLRLSSMAGTTVHDGVVSHANTQFAMGAGIILAGTSWDFQAIYRDPALPNCTGANFNLTNAVAVAF